MAKTQGSTEANKAIEEIKSVMSTSQLEQAQSKALKCYESNFKGCR